MTTTLFAAVTAPAASAPSSDRAATDAYVGAAYHYEQAALANVPGVRAAVEGLASRLASECPGVLRDGPPEPPPGTPFARRVGESKREDEQQSELEGELSETVRLTLVQADRQPLLEFAAATRSLQWTNPTLTQAIDAQATGLEAELALALPNVCADMQAWVASGYRTLTAATHEFAAKREAIARTQDARFDKSVARLFASHESAADKALVATTKALYKEREKRLAGLTRVGNELLASLGVVHEKEPTVSHPPPDAIVIGKGRTASGGAYEVLLLQGAPPGSRQRGERCSQSHPLSVRIVTTLNMDVSGCFARSESTAPPRVSCDEGLLTIEARTGAAVRAVSLHLSDDRRITSRVAFIPANLGGPTGFYFQVVRGPSPIPVSLTELSADGKPLRVLKLHPFKGCIKHLLKFLHHGIRTLVHGQVPHGPAFSIVGETYRFLGHIHFAIKVDIVDGGGGGESPSGRKPKLFSWALWQECKPHPYTILYGLLKRPTDTVLARIGGSLHALPRVTIPAHLHAGGVLVYLPSATAPRELQVRDPAGKTILTEHLGRLAAEATETCQAKAEGAGQSG